MYATCVLRYNERNTLATHLILVLHPKMSVAELIWTMDWVSGLKLRMLVLTIFLSKIWLSFVNCALIISLYFHRTISVGMINECIIILVSSYSRTLIMVFYMVILTTMHMCVVYGECIRVLLLVSL